MSNDVQVARVAKISTEVPRRQQRKTSGGVSGIIGVEGDDEVEFVFGSISPRGGGPNISLGGTQKQLVGSYELDSPEHNNKQRDTTESDNNISSCSTLDIVNKVEQLSVQQLETRVRELSQRLQQADEQRSALQHQLTESNVEKEMCRKRLEVVSASHECRITEMHCVIAELSKKLRNKHEHIIMEEQEPEGSELSYQECSVYNSELNLTNPDAECQTEPLDDLEAPCSVGEELTHSVDNNDIQLSQDIVNKGQLEALQEEVLHLRGQIALLQAKITTKDEVIEQTNVTYFAGDAETYESNNLDKADNRHVCPPLASPQKRVPAVTKIAERVKLHCASKSEHDLMPDQDESPNNEAIDIMEHLVTELKEHNSFMDPLQLNNDLQQLQREMEQLKIRNTLISLTLDESKQHTEHLYLLCGKYESNAVALQLALNCSDRAIEGYDVMLALLESKSAMQLDATSDSRRAVEAVARHLLARLESEKNVCENSLGPWQNSFNLNSSETPKNTRNWCADDDNRLRYHVSKLKAQRSAVQHTIVNLESPFCDFYEKKRLALEEDRSLRDEEKKSPMDLETAVLMQELLELRDQNLQLKTKLDESERERQHSNERIDILHEALKQLQLQMQLTADSNLLFEHQINRVSFSEAEHAALTEQQLVEALTRETELKGRIQTLIANVTATQKISDEKYEQLHQNVRELQKSNHNLGQVLDQNKRKYQLRIRKLEQKITDLKLEHEQRQADLMKHKSGLKAMHHAIHVPETTL